MWKADIRTPIVGLVLLTTVWAAAALAQPIYYTEVGTGPDKWASVWYLEKIAYTKDSVAIVSRAETESMNKEQLFDVHGGRFNRTGSSTTYSAILQHYPPGNDVPIKLGDIVREIEIDAWSGLVSLESQIVEQAFRKMQLRYGRLKVTKACYMQFIDAVAEQLSNDSLAQLQSPEQLIPSKRCLNAVATEPLNTPLSRKVPTLPLDNVLELVASDQDVVFVDTRESWEFDEGHIPGAINMILREINDSSAERLRSTDTVIAYCVKDFRGFEAARKLRSYGVNAVIMTPHGMRGWIGADLPVAGSRGESESAAAQELLDIARNSENATN